MIKGTKIGASLSKANKERSTDTVLRTEYVMTEAVNFSGPRSSCPVPFPFRRGMRALTITSCPGIPCVTSYHFRRVPGAGREGAA